MMTLEEFYEDCRQVEEWRKRCRCCENCQHYYEEEGMANCKKHDIPVVCLDSEYISPIDYCKDWE